MNGQVATGFWNPYPDTKPEKVGHYLTFNDWGFASIELWTGTRWRYTYNPDEIHITHFTRMVSPDGKEIE